MRATHRASRILRLLSVTAGAALTALISTGAAATFPQGTFVGIFDSTVNADGAPCPTLLSASAFGAAATVITDAGGNGAFAEAIVTNSGQIAFVTSCTVSGGDLQDCNTTVSNSAGTSIASAMTLLMGNLVPKSDSYVLTPGDIITVPMSCAMTDASYSRPPSVELTRELNVSETTSTQVAQANRAVTRETITVTGSQARAGLSRLRRGNRVEASNGILPTANGLRYQGVAAGDGFEYPVGVWAAYQHSSFEDDFVATAFDAHRNSVLAGIDVSPWDNVVFGVSFGYEDTDTDTTFNTGNIAIDGFTVAPYMGYYASDSLGVSFDVTVDLTVGFSSLDVESRRGTGAALVTGETETDRVFAGGNLNIGKQFGSLYLNGFTGLLLARADIDAFTESDGTATPETRTEFGQLRVGAEAAYSFHSFEPFASLAFEHDYERTELAGGHPNDPNNLRGGLGLRYFGNTWSGGVEYSTIFDREKFDEDTVTLTIRGDF